MKPEIADCATLLELREISKRFGPKLAVDAVSFDVRVGETHALLGENGAGKSTLMNIAAGMFRPDGGSILIDGRHVVLRNPKQAYEHGIGMVHQQYRLVAGLTVAENLYLGWSTAPKVAGQRKLEQASANLARDLGMEIDTAALVRDLSLGAQQRTAILRALLRGARLLILDEPTSVLTPQEATGLFATINELKARGIGIVFITHKLNEVLTLSDRVTILRSSRRVTTLPRAECTAPQLARLMVGTEIAEPAHGPISRGQAVLRVSGISARGDATGDGLSDVTLHTDEHEILGIAGVSGNGQRELAEVLTGVARPERGSVAVDGREMLRATPRDFTHAGVGHIPESQQAGLAMKASLEANAVAKVIGDSPIRRGPFISRRRIREESLALLARAGLPEIDPRRPALSLSGGQAQRILVHREIELARRLLVAVHPTRGLDIGATARVHELLLAARANGRAIVLISEDLDELLALSDRIGVLFRGRLVGLFPRNRCDREQLGLLMGGVVAGEEGN